MTINELDEKLEESIEELRESAIFEINDKANNGNPYLTVSDLEQLYRDAYYTFNDFKKHTIKYLKDSR